MTVYHFCSRVHVVPIRTEGLTRGVIPWEIVPKIEGMKGPQVKFAQGFQWLTVNPEWDQSWLNSQSRLPYKRNDYRITVAMPPDAMPLMHQWLEFCEKHKPPLAPDLNQLGDPQNWYVFQGIIPPRCFVAIEQNPNFEARPNVQLVGARGEKLG